jgi:rare lipoprotein A
VHPVKWLLVLLAAFAVACGGKSEPPKKRVGAAQSEGYRGQASWYGGKHHGGPTASGERFNKNALTAAHRTFPMGTRVRVTNLRNGRSVVVRINDRGPYSKGRIIDLSEAAAKQLDMIEAGVVPVKLERLP